MSGSSLDCPVVWMLLRSARMSWWRSAYGSGRWMERRLCSGVAVMASARWLGVTKIGIVGNEQFMKK